MNRITIDGRLTKDPEMRATASGKEVCTFSLASDRANNNDDKADFFNCSVFGKTAERAQKYLSKGRRIILFGSVTLREYTTKAGKHGASLDVLVDDFWFCDKKSDAPAEVSDQGWTDLDTSDIPF